MHALLGTDEAFTDNLKTDISNCRSLLCSAGQSTGKKVSLHLPIFYIFLGFQVVQPSFLLVEASLISEI